jgi:hypothetical protein
MCLCRKHYFFYVEEHKIFLLVLCGHTLGMEPTSLSSQCPYYNKLLPLICGPKNTEDKTFSTENVLYPKFFHRRKQ